MGGSGEEAPDGEALLIGGQRAGRVGQLEGYAVAGAWRWRMVQATSATFPSEFAATLRQANSGRRSTGKRYCMRSASTDAEFRRS